MSTAERYGHRDLTYSNWHRVDQIATLLGGSSLAAYQLGQIDIDGVEYCLLCRKVLALVEAARDVGQDKNFRVTREAALMAGVRAWVVLYTPAEPARTCGSCGSPVAPWPDIARFRVKAVAPTVEPYEVLSPDEWARRLVQLRIDHRASSCDEYKGWFGDRQVDAALRDALAASA